MPQLLILAALGIGAYAGYRWLRARGRAAQLKAAKRAPQAATSDRARNAGDLVWDEKKGVYRPRS